MQSAQDQPGSSVRRAAVVSPIFTTSTFVLSGVRVSSGESKLRESTPATVGLLCVVTERTKAIVTRSPGGLLALQPVQPQRGIGTPAGTTEPTGEYASTLSTAQRMYARIASRNSGSAGSPASSIAATKQTRKRSPRSSIGPLPECMSRTELSSPQLDENTGGPPSTSAQ